MDSIKRIYRACRAAIAELALNTYFIAPGILLIVAISMIYSSGDSDSSAGVLRNGYTVLDPELITSLITGIGWLAATIISGTIVNKYFKEENRGIHYFSMPLSPGERFAATLTVNWLFVSIVSFVPLILIAVLAYYLRPDHVLMASPFENAHWLAVGPLIHLVTMAFWLFPTVAYAKQAGYAVVGTIAAIIVYMTKTRGRYSDHIDLDHTATAFESTDVVGLSKYEFLSTQVTKAGFAVPDPEVAQVSCLAIVVVLMIFAAYLAFTRKTV